MRLSQITIENFGIYQGINTLSFPYHESKKVSVIIGKNGSGKTTFLNAVKTCFFGSMILRNRTITKNYENYILNKLNKNALKDSTSSYSIESKFISNLHNFDGEFTIKRSWLPRGHKIEEEVILLREGIILTPEEQEHFFNILYHAFPLDLFELFYLDGEKIDQLSVLSTNLIDLLESSINIDLFKNLKNDLVKYAISKTNSKQLVNLEQNRQSLVDIITEHKCELNQHINDLESNGDMLIVTNTELNHFKATLNITSINIDSNIINELQETINDKKNSIHNLLVTYLPYATLLKQLSVIEANIDHEESNKKGQTIQNAMSLELENHLIKKLSKQNSITVKETLNEISNFYSSGNKTFIHRLNSEDYYNLKSKLSDIYSIDQKTLVDEMKSLKILESEIKQLSQEAEEYNAAEKAGELDQLLLIQSKLAKIELEHESLNNQISDIEEKINTRNASLKETNKEIWIELKKSNVNNIIESLNIALEKYISTVKKDKIAIIEKKTKIMFDRLIRKEGFINDFKIDENMIYLRDIDGNQLDHSHLSAGEKQLFVLSLIYAIIKTSERTVPMIFDTLLGRLDEEHRDNVFKEFISSCPDQVIILATDSELSNIDKEYLKTITNIEYTIDFSDKTEKFTVVR